MAEGELLTVTLNVTGTPKHPLCAGVAVIVEMVWFATCAAINVGIAPVPAAAIPELVLLFVHATVAVGLLVTKGIEGTMAPSQTELEMGVTTVGIGFTVIVKLLPAPLHVPALEIMEIVATTGIAELFVATKEGKPALPDDAKPILV